MAQYDVDVPKLVMDGKGYCRGLQAESTDTCAAGEVQVVRSFYRHEAEPAIVPRERHAGTIEGHWTPWAARQMVVMTSLLPPQTGARVFAELGMLCPSQSSLDRLPKAINAVWEADRENFEQQVRAEEMIPEGTVTVSLDGGMTPRKDGQR